MITDLFWLLLIAFAISVVLGFVWDELAHLMAGLCGLFLAFEVYSMTTSVPATIFFIAIGLGMMLRGIFGTND